MLAERKIVKKKPIQNRMGLLIITEDTIRL